MARKSSPTFLLCCDGCAARPRASTLPFHRLSKQGAEKVLLLSWGTKDSDVLLWDWKHRVAEKVFLFFPEAESAPTSGGQRQARVFGLKEDTDQRNITLKKAQKSML